jgi:aspartate kinase
MKIGLIGMGVVNKGVYDIITSHPTLKETFKITSVLVKDKSETINLDIDQSVVTDQRDVFLSKDMDVVMEAITARDVAYDLLMSSLRKNRHIISASKATISRYYKDLHETAKKHQVKCFFEASVGGGIPVLKPLLHLTKTDQVLSFKAILNGTSNYILTKMSEDHTDYQKALKEAQLLGYAEADPTDDVMGYDARRKTAILANLSYNTVIDDEQITTSGIDGLKPIDFDQFNDLGCVIKVLGQSKLKDGTISASVEPVLIQKDHPLSNVINAYNMIMVHTVNSDDIGFYGPGAGRYPTANAMVSNLLDILQSSHETVYDQTYEFVSSKNLISPYYFRIPKMSLKELNSYGFKYELIRQQDEAIGIIYDTNIDEIQHFLKISNLKDSVFVKIDESVKLDITPTMDDIIVKKYGGTSVESIKQINQIAHELIQEANNGLKIVTIVSAMGKTTNQLIQQAEQLTPHINDRELDVLLSTGEQVTISLLAMAIRQLGHPVVSLTGAQSGIITDDTHSDARIIKVNTRRIFNELRNGAIVIVAGFQGVNKKGDITTLGRGGSDTTAVAIAASLNAKRCEIFTDVSGVYTADPRIVKNAKKWESISYDEMIEFSYLGAKVLHPRSVELAKKYQVDLMVASSFEKVKGTMILEENMIEKVLVRGITKDENIVKLSILNVPDKPGIAYQLFNKLAEQNIVVDIIIQALSKDQENDITFTIKQQDFSKAYELTKAFGVEVGARDVTYDDHVIKLSLVGIGMSSSSSVAATFFKALSEANINIEMISTSQLKISCIIQNNHVDEAIKRVHDYFQLGETIK